MCAQRPCKCSVDLIHVERGESAYAAVIAGPVGAFCFTHVHEGDLRYEALYVKLPCQHFPDDEPGELHVLPVYRGEQPIQNNRASWKWDGNEQRPTLTPSILSRVGKEGGDHSHLEELWHGYITAGRAVSC